MAFAGAVGGSLTGYYVQITPTSPNPVNVPAYSSVDVTETVSGVRAGDFVFTIPPSSADTKLVYSSPYVSADDTVKYRITNVYDSTNASAYKVNTFFVLKINNANDEI